MEEFIKRLHCENEDAMKEISESKFDILMGGTTLIHHEYWEKLVQPGCAFHIRLHSQKDKANPKPMSEDEEKDDTSEDFVTLYETKVKYRVDYYVKSKSPWTGEPDTFLDSRSDDTPVLLKDKARTMPVLEEITTVIFSTNNSARIEETELKQKRKMKVGDTLGKKKLHICSPLLLNVLRSIVKYSSNEPSGDDADVFKDGIFPHPFPDLYHHKQELADYKNPANPTREKHTAEYNAECDRHIDLLIDYLDSEPNVQLNLQKAKWEEKTPNTTFSGFWLLMKPGTDVYVKENGKLNAYVVDYVTGGVEYLFKESRGAGATTAARYEVHVWNLGFDGKIIQRICREIRVLPFNGEREITSLLIFPTRFHDRLDGGLRRKQLIESGKNYFQFCKKPSFLEYTGSGLKAGLRMVSSFPVSLLHS
jgi:hypothetical protein